MPHLPSFNHERLKKDGRYLAWRTLLERCPSLSPGWHIEDDRVCVGETKDQDLGLLTELAKSLLPWRKGPWSLGGVEVDSEWQGGMKWRRVQPHIDLVNQKVLDVGAGNGYFGWRMLAAGAKSVTACDPTALFVVQHQLIQQLAGAPEHQMWACRIEELPLTETDFDVVFSMGVLSHRRYQQGDHRAHLGHLYRRLRPGGQCVLETLIVPDEACETMPNHDRILQPQSRYARMKNVYALPSQQTLSQWLANTGFVDIALVDVAPTTVEEQRATEWMPYQSLVDGLSETDQTQTIEGYPAPIRAIAIGYKPPHRSDGQKL